MTRLSISCVSLHQTYKHNLTRRALQKLLQAVVDDDRTTAQRIVDNHPELLLAEPAAEQIKFVESQYTFQQFLPEKALIMAQKLRRLKSQKSCYLLLRNLEAIRWER